MLFDGQCSFVFVLFFWSFQWTFSVPEFGVKTPENWPNMTPLVIIDFQNYLNLIAIVLFCNIFLEIETSANLKGKNDDFAFAAFGSQIWRVSSISIWKILEKYKIYQCSETGLVSLFLLLVIQALLSLPPESLEVHLERLNCLFLQLTAPPEPIGPLSVRAVG